MEFLSFTKKVASSLRLSLSMKNMNMSGGGSMAMDNMTSGEFF